LGYLEALRAALPARVAASAAGNGAIYTRLVEDGYRQFWRDLEIHQRVAGLTSHRLRCKLAESRETGFDCLLKLAACLWLQTSIPSCLLTFNRRVGSVGCRGCRSIESSADQSSRCKQPSVAGRECTTRPYERDDYGSEATKVFLRG
jgi:hypothetical protein